MKSPRSRWLVVSILLVPLVNSQAPQPQTPQTTATAAMANLAQRQREATLAAMQASVDKQHASVTTGIAGSIGKQAKAPDASFFSLPPLPPPVLKANTSFTMPEAT